VSSRWVKWFSEEDSTQAGEDFERSLNHAHECLKVAEMPWFVRYLEHLDSESTRPGHIGDHLGMVASVARANTLKEMRAHLLDEIAKARAFIASAKEA
jgi:hypothetical protein